MTSPCQPAKRCSRGAPREFRGSVFQFSSVAPRSVFSAFPPERARKGKEEKSESARVGNFALNAEKEENRYSLVGGVLLQSVVSCGQYKGKAGSLVGFVSDGFGVD